MKFFYGHLLDRSKLYNIDGKKELINNFDGNKELKNNSDCNNNFQIIEPKNKITNIFKTHDINFTAILSTVILRKELFDFIQNLSKHNPAHSKLFVMLKVKFEDGSYVSLTKLNKANWDEIEDLVDSLVSNFEMKMDKYNQKPASKLILNYLIQPNAQHIKSQIFNVSENNVESNFSYKGYNLPTTTNLIGWGEKVKSALNTHLIKKSNSNIHYKIIVFSDHQEVSVTINDNVLFKFKDYFGIDDKSFRRVIESNEYIFHDGKEVLYIIERQTNNIENIKTNSKFRLKLWTIDIETRVIDNFMVPYCICLYNGKKALSYFITDFNSAEEMLSKAITDLIIPANNNALIYAHNLSNFDGAFILKIIAKLAEYKKWKFTPILREGRIIELKISFKVGKDTVTIKFRDSLLLLPASLRKLADSFGVLQKSYFPHRFINGNDLNYVGKTPAYKYWDDITLKEFNEIKSDNWNLKEEAIKYCIQDCITLYQIIYKFAKLIFSKWNVNLNKYPTLPSLAFAIYRSNFMKEFTIPKISGKMYEDIKQSYTGGHTDTYKPSGEDLYHYDVNSLYPSVMATYEMPVGKSHYFKGDILSYNKNAHGFFLCDIIAPDNLERPLLQTRVKTDNGIRTVAPLGKWTDWVYSEELHKYKEYGYKFTVIEGYLFEKKKPIFLKNILMKCMKLKKILLNQIQCI